MLARAFDNSEFTRCTSRTIAALDGWNGQGLPPDAAFRSLAEDMKAAVKERKQSVIADRLNREVVGYYSVIARTAREIDRVGLVDARHDLIAIEPAWGSVSIWQAITRASSPISSFNLLAALDLRRSPIDGSVISAPAEQAIYVALYIKTIWISVWVTIACVALGYPVAAFIASLGARGHQLALFAVLMPLWTSILVRSAAWIILLQKNGIVNQLLQGAGITGEPLELIFNRLGTYIVTIHVMLPFLILPTLGVMRSTPAEYMRAALSLGAPPWRAFVSVYLPLTLPGVLAGATLVFVLSLGNYLTPALVGGSRDQMISYFIYFYMNQQLNWGMAASLCLVLILFIFLIGMVALATRRFVPILNTSTKL
ncbi:ABC transporter permease [Mesorhizobium sp. B2-4-13]|uniref:ABC transporter permease n=1 Tax=Mesorhizobium sp. B2-4-13 TaxID=2589936 RepID=UPI0015EFCCC5|nr:ABC transporter permease [Mesorhizobium sp. B2-4-13]